MPENVPEGPMPTVADNPGPSQRHRPSMLAILLGAAVVVIVVLAALLVRSAGTGGESGATQESGPSNPRTYSDAKEIVGVLNRKGLVSTCQPGEYLTTVTITSQQRCDLTGAQELIVLTLPGPTEVEAQIDFFRLTSSNTTREMVVIRGSNWLINLGDVDPVRYEPIRSATAGTIVRGGHPIAASPTATPAPVPTRERPKGIPGDGVFRIPQEVKPGTYRTAGPIDDNCYWARLSNLTGDSDSILANGSPAGPAAVTIRKGDRGFETSGCEDWEKVG